MIRCNGGLACQESCGHQERPMIWHLHLAPLQKIYGLYGMLALFNSCMVAGKSLYRCLVTC